MTKKESLLQDLTKALMRLKEAVDLPQTSIHQDATIQRFEFTFELSWKLMYAILQEEKNEVLGMKNIIREAARLNLIEDPIIWFDFLQARNLTVHTYEEEMAKQIYAKAKEFVAVAEEFVTCVQKYIQTS